LSTLKTASLQHPDASSNTIHLSASGNVGIGTNSPTAKLDLGGNNVAGISSINSGQVSGRRNLIINGDMQIAQRNSSVAGISSSSTYQVVDRMFIRNSGAGTFTNSHSTDNPGYGLKRSIKFECTTADSSLAADDFAYMGYKMEGFDAVKLLKGETGAGYATLSFWVKSSETGTAVVRFVDIPNNRSQGHAYTINAADTWEKKTITISMVDGSNKVNYDNTSQFVLVFWLAVSTNRTSGTLQSSWTNNLTADEAVSQTVNIVNTTSSYINFTGLQFEVGDTATSFEHISYGEQLALCQRYYEKSYNDTVVPGSVDVSGWSGGDKPSGTAGRFRIEFKTTKRGNPTVTTYHHVTGTSGQMYTSTNGSVSTAISGVGMNRVQIAMNGGALSGNAEVGCQWTADSEI